MSSSISTLAATLPSASPFYSRRRKPINNVINFSLKANGNHRGSEVRDNLDHLQRASKQQQATQIPKKRIVQSAPLGSWDRFPSARTIQQMMDTMDSLINDPFAYTTERSNLSTLPTENEPIQSSYRRGRTPWEIKEKENEYKLRFDMPGMTKSDVKVYVEEKMMVIKAEKMVKEEGKEEEEEEWSARSYGKYNTRIALPENVEVEKIRAEVKDGVLYITIPKVPASAKVLDIAVQ